jgi:hypothetical protein
MIDGLRTLAIPLGFILLAAVVGWFLVTAKARWWIKLTLIIVLPAFGLAVWDALDSYRGWPAPIAPPEKAQFVWAVIQEPLPGEKGTGMICLWLLPYKEPGQGKWLEFVRDAGEPRAFRAPYSRRLHRALTRALQMVRQGQRVMFDRTKMGEWPPKDGQHPRRRGGYSEFDSRQPRFYQMPSQSPYQKEP